MKKLKILLLSDSIQTHSGVANVSKDIILNTLDRISWIQISGGIVGAHPDYGKVIDLSKQVSETANQDCVLRLYPTNGYGNPLQLREVIKLEKPDAIIHFTDPRFWGWLYNMEYEIRKDTPLLYYHVWDNFPSCSYNASYYNSCDLIMCISKLTEKVVNDVAPEVKTKFIPHGTNEQIYRPLTEKDNYVNPFKDFDFVILYNNRNIARKMTMDVIESFNMFCNKLPIEKRKKCLLVMKTNPLDKNGSNLYAVKEKVCPNNNVHFINEKLTQQQLNTLYNSADVTINIASQEGFGLSSLESMMAGTMVINNQTGGLKDQSDGKWCVKVHPKSRSIIGSLETPYIYEERSSTEDVANAMYRVYKLHPAQRKKNGLIGREFALKNMTANTMANTIVDEIESLLKVWKPRPDYKLHKI